MTKSMSEKEMFSLLGHKKKRVEKSNLLSGTFQKLLVGYHQNHPRFEHICVQYG